MWPSSLSLPSPKTKINLGSHGVAFDFKTWTLNFRNLEEKYEFVTDCDNNDV